MNLSRVNKAVAAVSAAAVSLAAAGLVSDTVSRIVVGVCGAIFVGIATYRAPKNKE